MSDHKFDGAFDELWSRRLPAPPSPLAQPSGFAGVRLSFEEVEASLEAAAERLALSRPRLGGDEVNALVDLGLAGCRPQFDIATGFSMGDPDASESWRLVKDRRRAPRPRDEPDPAGWTATAAPGKVGGAPPSRPSAPRNGGR